MLCNAGMLRLTRFVFLAGGDFDKPSSEGFRAKNSVTEKKKKREQMQ